MADEKDLKLAQQVYADLCHALDSNDWHYTRHDAQLAITAGARGEDLPIEFSVEVDAERKLVILLSHLSFAIPEDKRIDMALAVSIANKGMVHGGFDYDIVKGKLLFRLSNSYIGCKLSDEALLYIVYCACGTVDNYNDKFLMICKGMLTLEQFIQSENG